MGLFKSKKRVTVFLSSGAQFSFHCDEIEIEWDKSTGKIKKYNVKGIPLYISPLDIQAILVK